jgi:thiol:disulfide interchange protein DsbC
VSRIGCPLERPWAAPVFLFYERLLVKELLMKNGIVAVLWLSLLFLPAAASAFPPGNSGDCQSCHKLDKKEAEDLIRKLNPVITVLDVRTPPVKGFWQIEVDAGEGKRGALMLDYAKKHFIVLSQLIPIDAIGKPQKTDFSKLPIKDTVVVGAKGAKRKVVVFTDPDCPYCQKLHVEMKQVVAKRSDIAFHLVLYPLPMHKDAYRKAQAVLCEKSQALLDDAFSGKDMPEPKCGKEQVEKNIELAKSLNINGTPTMVRDDGTMLSAFLPADKLIEWIDGK